MALRFNAGDYFQAAEAGQNRDDQRRQQLADSLTAIPQAIVGYAGQQKQQGDEKRQQHLKNIQMALEAGKEGYDANKFLGGLPGEEATPMLNNSQPSLAPNAPLMPNFGPQMASAGVSDTGGPRIPQNSPSQAPASNMPMWEKFVSQNPQYADTHPSTAGMFQKQAPDYGKTLAEMNQGQYGTYAGMNPKEQDHVEKIREFDLRNKELNQKKSDSSDFKYQQEQDRLEQNAMTRTASLRGDKSLSDAESKRDASITVYNTISKIKGENRMPSKLEYYDLLGQMWKARTGASPTDQALKDLDSKTFKGDIGRAYTYITGNTAPATTQQVLDNIQSFARDSGEQADQFHGGYMRTHLLKPKGLAEDRWNPIATTGRGLSFKEATHGEQAAPGKTKNIGRFKVTVH